MKYDIVTFSMFIVGVAAFGLSVYYSFNLGITLGVSLAVIGGAGIWIKRAIKE